jgi:hypothetical protein
VGLLASRAGLSARRDLRLVIAVMVGNSPSDCAHYCTGTLAAQFHDASAIAAQLHGLGRQSVVTVTRARPGILWIRHEMRRARD